METANINYSSETSSEQTLDPSLSDVINRSVKEHLATIRGLNTTTLYEDFLAKVEPALFEAVMKYTRNNNQSQAAKILGLSRGTTRKKLKQYFGDHYCGTREEQQEQAED